MDSLEASASPLAHWFFFVCFFLTGQRIAPIRTTQRKKQTFQCDVSRLLFSPRFAVKAVTFDGCSFPPLQHFMRLQR
jgi:hypothetical protein